MLVAVVCWVIVGAITALFLGAFIRSGQGPRRDDEE